MTDHVPPVAVSPPEDAAPPVARTTLMCAAHMLDACAENMQKLAVGYGAEQMREIARQLREGTPTLEQALKTLAPSLLAVPEGRLRELADKWRAKASGLGYGALDATWSLENCADELDALLASLSPPSEGQ